MKKDPPLKLDREILRQLASEQLVEIIIEQAIVIEQLQATIEKLKQEIEQLRVSRDLDSKTSSKPPSGDLLKKPETKKVENLNSEEKPKRKPGGQPGHEGKTPKGFGRVDRYEILRPYQCSCCGRSEFADSPVRVETQQVVQLVERPIEIVEYQNLAERSLRLAVTKRKVSGGSRSMERFQDTANLLTVVQTCRRQGRSVIHFFEQALKAQLRPSQLAPSLIPQSKT